MVRKALRVKFEQIQMKLNHNWRSDKLEEIIKNFDDLTISEQEELVKYIIEKKQG